MTMIERRAPFVLVKKPDRTTHIAPIVLVHGSWGASWMWENYIEYFAARGWAVYALDLRGHGESGGSVAGARMSDYADDIRSAIETHALADPVVIGHSMGALVALMYAARNPVRALVAIDPSPSEEVQGAGEAKTYPAEYSPTDAGMPVDPAEVMKAFPDIPQDMLMRMKDMLGMESGIARTERKVGVSVPKETLAMPILFVGGEFGESVPFGVGIRTARAMAAQYSKEVVEITGASHPGILVGVHAVEAAHEIEEWLSRTVG